MKDLKDLSEDLVLHRLLILFLDGHKPVQGYVCGINGTYVELSDRPPESKAESETYVLDQASGRVNIGDKCTSGYSVIAYDVPSGLPKRPARSYASGQMSGADDQALRRRVHVSRLRGRPGGND